MTMFLCCTLLLCTCQLGPFLSLPSGNRCISFLCCSCTKACFLLRCLLPGFSRFLFVDFFSIIKVNNDSRLRRKWRKNIILHMSQITAVMAVWRGIKGVVSTLWFKWKVSVLRTNSNPRGELTLRLQPQLSNFAMTRRVRFHGDEYNFTLVSRVLYPSVNTHRRHRTASREETRKPPLFVREESRGCHQIL